MSDLANSFSTMFREEHRAVRDALLDLMQAFEQRSSERARTLVGRIAALTGPHFRYEEETLYPALVEIFGSSYIRSLYQDHDGAIQGAERLAMLSNQDAWNETEVEEGIALVRDILPHVSDCDGLSIMVERLPDNKIEEIFTSRERCNKAGVDLLQWAQEFRESTELSW